MANCAPPAPDAPREPPASDHARVSASASAASHMGMSEGEGGEVDAMLQLLRSLDAIMPVANRVYVEAYTESGMSFHRCSQHCAWVTGCIGHVYYWHVTEQRSSWSTPEGFEPLRSLAAKLALCVSSSRPCPTPSDADGVLASSRCSYVTLPSLSLCQQGQSTSRSRRRRNGGGAYQWPRRCSVTTR